MAAKPPVSLWTDAELQSTVETYIYLLRLEQAGITYSLAEIINSLQTNFLKNRNDASIRYRMRNISWVFSVNGLPIIPAYSPAPQVGSGVQERIERILRSHTGIENLRSAQPKHLKSERREGTKGDRKNAINQLEKLRKALAEIEQPSVGIGHNRPPDPIENVLLSEISETTHDIKRLEIELQKESPNLYLVEKRKSSLISFGLKMANWIGGRLTNFTDAVLTSFAAIAIAKMTHVLPLLLNAIEAVGRLLP